MYIPPSYQLNDPHRAFSLIRSYPFGMLVTVGNGDPVISHLPFLLEYEGDKPTLYTHLARANTQFSPDGPARATAVFRGPHGFISPRYYMSSRQVPTWNYVAVEVSGPVWIIDEPAEKMNLLDRLTSFYDPQWMNEWNVLRETRGKELLDGFYFIAIEIESMQAVEKINQDKSAGDRKAVAEALGRSGRQEDTELARYMREVFGF